VYGHYYRAKTNYALDTTMTKDPFASTMVQEYQKTLSLAQADKVKFKNQAIESSKLLAGYFNNIKQNKDSALIYLKQGLEFDTSNVSIKELIKYLETARSRNGKATGMTKSVSSRNDLWAVKNKNIDIPKA
jgi:hypothetical protein